MDRNSQLVVTAFHGCRSGTASDRAPRGDYPSSTASTRVHVAKCLLFSDCAGVELGIWSCADRFDGIRADPQRRSGLDCAPPTPRSPLTAAATIEP